MSNSKWYAFKCRVADYIATHLPEKVKRFVLYDLQSRVRQRINYSEPDYGGSISFDEMCAELKD